MNLAAAVVVVGELSLEVVKAEGGALKRVMLSFRCSLQAFGEIGAPVNFWCEGVGSVP